MAKMRVLFSKSLDRALADREWTVKLVPSNGGDEITVKGIRAIKVELAMHDAALANPGYIAKSARCTKILG